MPHAAGVSMSVHLSLAARRGARWRGGTLLPLVACLAASAASAQPAPVQPAGHERMLQALAQVAGRTADTNLYQGDAPARQLREQLAAMPPESTDQDLLTVRMQLGAQELRLGNVADAIEQFTQARALLAQMPGEIPAVVAIETAFQLGLAHFRLGQTRNCVTEQPPAGCILPLTGAGIFTQQDASRQAILHFAEVLRNEPPGTEQYLEAQWLLNIAYMTLGGYPDWMPQAYVLPPRAFDSGEPAPRFANVALALGLDTPEAADLSGGAVGDDFDNDGYLDIVVSTMETRGQLRFFRNNRDGTFTDRTDAAGLRGLYGGLNLVQADYDNDGNVDLLVLRGAWLEQHGQHPNSLLRNNGDGTFTDVTFDAGLGAVHYPTQTAAFADYDNDGDLDLYVGNETTEAFQAPCQLFRNDGEGAFTDVAAEAGVENGRFSKSVVWGDFDGDRWPDLYVSNYGQANRLYRNNADGTFTDVAPELGVTGPEASFPAWFWDYDNDGALDLYVSAYVAGTAHLAADALGLPLDIEMATLYRGNGGGQFTDVSVQQRISRPSAPMGSNFGDLDNDGFLDFYLGTGNPLLEHVMPNVMYRNDGGTGFTDVTAAGGFGTLQKGHGVVFADFDHDGDQDVFEQLGGAVPADRAGNAFFENPGFGNRWVTVKLVGVGSNRSAIGARIRVDVIEDGARRSIYKRVNSGGTFGANPLRQTIGLGGASRIERLEVFWPTTGLAQTFVEVPLDRLIEITEGMRQFTILELESLTLGSGR